MLLATGNGRESKPSRSSSSIQMSQPCHHFEFHDIMIATQNFDESLVIGTGGFGNVYKGSIINGANRVIVAIKRLDSVSNQGASEFWAEVEMLSMLRHCNLVSLIGYCNHKTEMILVYEYMPNGTLDDHLHKLHTSLSWLQRLNICIGAGRGLHYLHTGTGIESGVIHRDVKSSNILLHQSWAAKVADFGLSKIGPTNQPATYVNTLVKGTFGYLDPNYFATGKLTRKSDVYAFGVVLLEVLCRKRAVDSTLNEDHWGLVAWVQDSIKDGNLKHIIDQGIRGDISPKCLREYVRIAERCLHNSPKQRPTMAEVVVSLEFALASQEKFNNSLNATWRTIFHRMVNLFPFSFTGEYSGPSPSSSVKVFRFVDLEIATSNFSLDLLFGEGSFGKVFLGWVNKITLAPSILGVEIAIAVKRLNKENKHGTTQWLTEIKFLGQLAHPNIIRLMGYCRDKHEFLLVYEYMPNKSLDRFLYGDDVMEPLSWGTRLLIMIGVARGLAYMHLKKVIHCDLRPSNILWDENFNAKLGNFGLAKYAPKSGETHVSTRPMGTIDYIAPEYLISGHLTTKSDIYSFGMILLECITGRRSMDVFRPNGEKSLVLWTTKVQPKGRNVKKIMDPRLGHKYPLQGASECASLALRCLVDKPKDRPSSEEVLKSLKQIYALYK